MIRIFHVVRGACLLGRSQSENQHGSGTEMQAATSVRDIQAQAWRPCGAMGSRFERIWYSILNSPREARDFKNYTEKKLIRPGPARPDRRRTVVKVPFFLIFFRIFLVTSRGVIGRTVYSRPGVFIKILEVDWDFI